MQELPASVLIAAVSISLSLLSAAVGIISYFLKDIKSSQKEKDKEQDKAIQTVKEDLAGFKGTMPLSYVQKDDFHRVIREIKDDQARAISGLEHKVDILSRDVREMMQEIGKHMGIGGKNTC